MKKVLITGYSGFVGRHCTKLFREMGAEVIGLNLHPGDEEQKKLVEQEIVCDLTDPIQTEKLALNGIDAVINLAGFAGNTGGDRDHGSVDPNTLRIMKSLIKFAMGVCPPIFLLKKSLAGMNIGGFEVRSHTSQVNDS